MSKVILGTTMSLDGFINDRNGSGSRLYADIDQLRESEVLQDLIRTTGAVVMGRHAYDMANGDFTGYEYQVPIFVITHDAPESVAKGENDKLSFTFVTDGVESAIEKARAAASGKVVTVIGSANIAQQCLRARLVDEVHIDLMPLLLGDGLRFFEHLGSEEIDLERIDVIEGPIRTHLKFRLVK